MKAHRLKPLAFCLTGILVLASGCARPGGGSSARLLPEEHITISIYDRDGEVLKYGLRGLRLEGNAELAAALGPIVVQEKARGRKVSVQFNLTSNKSVKKSQIFKARAAARAGGAEVWPHLYGEHPAGATKTITVVLVGMDEVSWRYRLGGVVIKTERELVGKLAKRVKAAGEKVIAVKLLLVSDARHTTRKVDRFKAACSLAGARFSRLAVRASSGVGEFGSTVGAGRSK